MVIQTAWLMCQAALIVGRIIVVADVAPIRDMVAYNTGIFGYAPNQTFHSTNLTAPVFGVNTWDADKIATHSSPYLFLTPIKNSAWSLLIFNSTDLSLVWAAPYPAEIQVMNLHPQTYAGKEYLTFWAGEKTGTTGRGSCHLYD